jgi:hypothetical protein
LQRCFLRQQDKSASKNAFENISPIPFSTSK